jgi:hypothetical protein
MIHADFQSAEFLNHELESTNQHYDFLNENWSMGTVYSCSRAVIASVEAQTIALRQSAKTYNENPARLCTGRHRIARMIRIYDSSNSIPFPLVLFPPRKSLKTPSANYLPHFQLGCSIAWTKPGNRFLGRGISRR